jgi:hypothetical protein
MTRTILIILGVIVVLFLWYLFGLIYWFIIEISEVRKARKELDMNRQISDKLLNQLQPALLIAIFSSVVICTIMLMLYIF